MSANGSAASSLLPPDLRMLERGWLSSNSLLMLGDPRGAVIVDTGYCTHKAQTLALVQDAIGPQDSLRLIVNTHLHSDHCGGNAHLSAEFNCPIWTPPGHYQAAVEWNDDVLSFVRTGQQCERFVPTRALEPGSVLEQGGREWRVFAAPGHDPHSLILFEPDSGVLLSADALWEQGFGIVFPEIDGRVGEGFDEVEATLDLIASLPVRVVVPGHGRTFADADQALGVARERLAFFRLNPARHARHAAKALIKYHLLETGQRKLPELVDWLAATPVHQDVWRLYFSGQSVQAWTHELLQELARSRAIRVDADIVFNT